MLKLFLLNTSLLLWFFLIPLAGHADTIKPIATVNGEDITQQDYDNYVSARARQNSGKEAPTEQTLIEELIQRELLRQDAIGKKLDKESEFAKKLQYMRDNMLMATAMQEYLEQHPLKDATLREEYNKQIATIEVPKEYKVRHILFRTEEEARITIAELSLGNAFGKLARKRSIDTGSAERNGNLGWITKQKVVPKFGDAMEKLKKGKYTLNPVKSKFGWHIIQLDDIRNVALPPFESVKDKITNALQNRQMQKYVRDLREQAKIEIFKKTD
jgi:peptidyl-prolyl cis-trans isomerase C